MPLVTCNDNNVRTFMALEFARFHPDMTRLFSDWYIFTNSIDQSKPQSMNISLLGCTLSYASFWYSIEPRFTRRLWPCFGHKSRNILFIFINIVYFHIHVFNLFEILAREIIKRYKSNLNTYKLIKFETKLIVLWKKINFISK